MRSDREEVMIWLDKNCQLNKLGQIVSKHIPFSGIPTIMHEVFQKDMLTSSFELYTVIHNAWNDWKVEEEIA